MSSEHTPVVAEQSPTLKKHEPPLGHGAPGVVHVTTAASCATSLAASVDASCGAGPLLEHAVRSTSESIERISVIYYHRFGFISMSYDAFTRASREGLEFLVRDWGFEVRASASKIEASVLFTRPDAFVCIMTERQCDPWVTVKLGTASFGLHARIAKLDPAYAKRIPSGESAVIAYYATFFRLVERQHPRRARARARRR